MNGLIDQLLAICTIIYHYYIKHDGFPRNYTMHTESPDMPNLARLYNCLDLCS